ncbi:MAG: type II toxin-antitoxin system VapC family toxin [Planctomycetaceae bacterium]
MLQRISAPGVILVASTLTRLECRVRPLRTGPPSLLQDYDDFFVQVISEMVSLSDEIMDRAAEIRAQHGFKTPDAIHLAAAVISGCDVFLTNDQQLTRFSGISVETVQP